MSNVDTLNTDFGISGSLRFKKDSSGLIIIEINNQHASAAVSLQGAHLLSWQPAGEEDVIWLSPEAKFNIGKSIRGGIPICWPWFGDHATQNDYPAHGFVRTLPWHVVQSETLKGGETRIALAFQPNDTSNKYWPYLTPLHLSITVGKTLELELTTTNQTDKEIVISEALHTYFNVSNVRNISVDGLNNCVYLDKVDGFKQKHQNGPVSFDDEVDRVYIDTETDCIIRDPNLSRQIHIKKRGSSSTVVWNPWVEKSNRMGDMGENGYLHMVCIESANAAANKATLAPGGEHSLWVSYSVETTQAGQ